MYIYVYFDAISNDLERTLTLFSRSHHSLTLNTSQTATDTAIVTKKNFLPSHGSKEKIR